MAEETKLFHANHSTEPWKLSHSGYANTPFVIFSGSRRPNWGSKFPLSGVNVIAEVFHDESPAYPEQGANAELLRAAPRMLRVLSGLAACIAITDHEAMFVGETADIVARYRETFALLTDLKKAGVF
jgi:hypothetical protein